MEFKKYKVTILEQKTKIIVEVLEQLSTTKKYVESKFRHKHEFDKVKKTVKVERLFKNPGV